MAEATTASIQKHSLAKKSLTLAPKKGYLIRLFDVDFKVGDLVLCVELYCIAAQTIFHTM